AGSLWYQGIPYGWGDGGAGGRFRRLPARWSARLGLHRSHARRLGLDPLVDRLASDFTTLSSRRERRDARVVNKTGQLLLGALRAPFRRPKPEPVLTEHPTTFRRISGQGAMIVLERGTRSKESPCHPLLPTPARYPS